jgi:methylenetetrahydrofolate dehydrogenase (NADP+)/methenyltetrahydrofolate cyclohydrolase
MILDGKGISTKLLAQYQKIVQSLSERKPSLAVLLVGEDPPSQIYVDRKTKACEHVGFKSIKKRFSESITEKNLLKEISYLNEDAQVDGILVQLPLPSHINPQKVTLAINPDKDVDGFHPLNMGKLLIGDPTGFVPCTPLGIKVLLEKTLSDLTGKHVIIIGRSIIVGKPLAALLMQREPRLNCTVTITNSYSKNLKELVAQGDILVSAVGRPLFVTADMVQEGATVIDVGINRVEEPKNNRGYRIVGDVDFEKVASKSAYITPVPGGVGPMTIAMLIHNTLKSFMQREKGKIPFQEIPL